MTNETSPISSPEKGATDKQKAREKERMERRAKALRDNLHRRKHQARAYAAIHSDPKEETLPPEAD